MGDGMRADPQPSSRHHHREPKVAAARRPHSSPELLATDAMRDGGDADDVDMGTPTAATNSRSDWREALGDDDGRGGAWGALDRADGASPPQTDSTARAGACHATERRGRYGESEASGDEGVVEIQAFREYSHDDIDSLDILPSQDFVGEVREESAAGRQARSSLPTTSAWLDFRDAGTQLREEEASEVFDNVIYAPPTLPPRAKSASPPMAEPSSSTPPIHHSSVFDDQYESESELSDGYEEPCAVFNSDRLARASSTSSPVRPSTTTAAVTAASSRASSVSGTPPQVPPVHWCARMSVKRDCSFIDQTLKHRRKQLSVQDLSESGEEFEEKLKLVDGDEDGDSEDNCGSVSTTKSLVASSPSHLPSVPKSNTGLSLPGFRPKKKRRKVRQLALDAFLKMQPSATY